MKCGVERGVTILQVASGYRNLDEFQLDGPHG